MNGLSKEFESFAFVAVVPNLSERAYNDYGFGLDGINFVQPVHVRRMRKTPKRPLFYACVNLRDSIRKFSPKAPCAAPNGLRARKQTCLWCFDLNENGKSNDSASACQVVRYFPARAFD